MDLTRLQKRISEQGWRSLEEWAGDPEFMALLEREFAVPPDGSDMLGRRDFLKLIGGTLGLAGLAGLGGCTVKPRGKIVPYVHQPEQIIPGKPLYYASSLEFAGFGRGVVVETHEGRPTKIEGNREHPASLGATSVFEQASLLDLYNPARSSALLKKGAPETWQAFLGELQGALLELPPGGEGLHLLTGTVTSPAFGEQWRELARRFPKARWHAYEPLCRDAAFLGAEQAFGRPLEARFYFDKARVIISFGGDFLAAMPGSVRYARDLMNGRKEGSAMNRLYVVEAAPTLTGAFADERRAVRFSEIAEYAAALAAKLGLPGTPPVSSAADSWATEVAADLRAGGAALLIAGMDQPPEVHALVAAMNALMNETAVAWSEPIEVSPIKQRESLKELVEALHGGTVRLLVMLGGDWVRTVPGDLGFEAGLGLAGFSIHSGLYCDETALAATWHLPMAHPLESWGDTRAFEGTASLMQPMIEPLYGGRSMHEVLDCLVRFPGRHGQEIIRNHWVQVGRLDEAGWRRALHDGVVANSAAPLLETVVAQMLPMALPSAGAEAKLTLLFTPDGSLWDGSYARNVWLQELPRPITKLSWENAFLVGPATAKRWGLATGDLVRLQRAGGRTLEGAVLVQPGVGDGTVALALGGGLWPVRPPEGRGVAAFPKLASDNDSGGSGIDAYPFRSSTEPWHCEVSLEKTGSRQELVRTQEHHLVQGRELLRMGTAAELQARYPENRETLPTLYNLTETMTDGYAWAMAIDLNRCIGCNACMVACQAENNIPAVGRDQVSRGREMHWIRVDSYYFGTPEEPLIAHQPVPCMHCEMAPCEPVCPVAATVHDHAGLNLQVYNRCIGTRYCSNNCPYKVRRFNFFRYAGENAKEPLLLMANPDVTVRARGVMEKCNYCVQRISEAGIRASIEDRKIRDGEVIPACAQACPTEAITFGNRNDPGSRVAKLKANGRNYSLLEELNTRPRTSYLARIRNPVSA